MTENASAAPGGSPGPDRAEGVGDEAVALREQVIAAIEECYDPEIPVNIYELGLIYDVTVPQAGKVEVLMTLTSPHCPVAEILPEQVKTRIAEVDGVDEVMLELTWEPPWSVDMMSDAARLELGLM